MLCTNIILRKINLTFTGYVKKRLSSFAAQNLTYKKL